MYYCLSEWGECKWIFKCFFSTPCSFGALSVLYTCSLKEITSMSCFRRNPKFLSPVRWCLGSQCRGFRLVQVIGFAVLFFIRLSYQIVLKSWACLCPLERLTVTLPETWASSGDFSDTAKRKPSHAHFFLCFHYHSGGELLSKTLLWCLSSVRLALSHQTGLLLSSLLDVCCFNLSILVSFRCCVDSVSVAGSFNSPAVSAGLSVGRVQQMSRSDGGGLFHQFPKPRAKQTNKRKSDRIACGDSATATPPGPYKAHERSIQWLLGLREGWEKIWSPFREKQIYVSYCRCFNVHIYSCFMQVRENNL